ncbi:MAG TPA: glycoside hydrolase family 97 N-terminal domain-containing protein, partial [Pyrinomonadaceae bacterium]
MRKNAPVIFSLLFIMLFCFNPEASAQEVASPAGRLTLSFRLTEAGEPTYRLSFAGRPVVLPSRLGVELKDAPALTGGFSIVKSETAERDETWEPVWGEVKSVRNRYRELAVTLRQASGDGRTVVVRFRLFDDGLGFRYEFPEQEKLKYFIVAGEKTEFNLAGDHKAFWIPGDYDTNEYAYSTTRLSEVDAARGRKDIAIAVKSIPGDNVVQTPLMLKTADGLYVNVHEAALVNYPAMNLDVNRQTFALSSHLVPDALGNKAYLQTPARTPWRTVVVSDRAADILTSKLILNLNEPSKVADARWIKPVKYVGIWWEMHVGKATWNYADVANVKLEGMDWAGLRPNGKHGATTANTKR